MNGRNFAHSITSEWDALIQKMIFHILVNYSIQTKVVYSIHFIMFIVMPPPPSYEQQSPKQHTNLLASWVAQWLPLPLLRCGCYPASATRTLPLPDVLLPLRRTGVDAAAAPVPEATVIVFFPLMKGFVDEEGCPYRVASNLFDNIS